MNAAIIEYFHEAENRFFLLCQGIKAYCPTYIWDAGSPLLLTTEIFSTEV